MLLSTIHSNSYMHSKERVKLQTIVFVEAVGSKSARRYKFSSRELQIPVHLGVRFSQQRYASTDVVNIGRIVSQRSQYSSYIVTQVRPHSVHHQHHINHKRPLLDINLPKVHQTDWYYGLRIQAFSLPQPGRCSILLDTQIQFCE